MGSSGQSFWQKIPFRRHPAVSRQPAYARFGLGKPEKVDVEVILPHSKRNLKRICLIVNQVLKVKQ